MSYLVLARKYRPKTFDQMVGQEHVLRALVNALEGGDLHHAYLFTGTRGVGKTTVARIFAKCLNNPEGITATPDLDSEIAKDIDRGGFIDLIEVDAASRTKVEQTRELLENMHYPPSQGRFRVYLIDEVHMLSTHSFNALLKTLEEPPEHVKFLLATTDPQKLPVTIVSRCLQFHLKQIAVDEIEQQLRTILDKEEIEHESQALRLIAQAGRGSLRDALSILDQAIAYTNRKITHDEIRSFLGVTDRNQLSELIESIVTGEAKKVLKAVSTITEFIPDYQQLLDELLLHFQQAALIQQITDHVLPDQEDNKLAKLIAEGMSPEQIQLYYQIALRGKHEIELVTNQRSALEMIILRMLTFTPVKQLSQITAQKSEKKSEPEQQEQNEQQAKQEQQPEQKQPQPETTANDGHKLQTNEDWQAMYSNIELDGFPRQIMGYAELIAADQEKLTFQIGEQHQQLLTNEYKKQIQHALSKLLATESITLEFEVGETPPENSPLMIKKQLDQQQQTAIEQNPEIKALVEHFDATIVSARALSQS